MPVHTVTCTECGAVLKSSSPLPAGKRVRCSQCHHPFTIPGEPATAVARPRPPAAAAEEAETSRLRRSRPEPEEEEAIQDAEPVEEEQDEEEEVVERPRRKSGKRKKKSRSGGYLGVGLIVGGVVLGLVMLGGISVAVWRFATDTSNWKEYAPDDVGLRLSLPSDPEPMAAPANLAAGVQAVKYRSKSGPTEFVFAAIDVPEVVIKQLSFDEMCRVEKDTVAQSMQGQVKNETAVTLGNYPGKEFQFEVAGKKGMMIERVFMAKDPPGARLFIVAVAGPWVKPGASQVDKFFNSVQVVNTGAASRKKANVSVPDMFRPSADLGIPPADNLPGAGPRMPSPTGGGPANPSSQPGMFPGGRPPGTPPPGYAPGPMPPGGPPRFPPGATPGTPPGFPPGAIGPGARPGTPPKQP